MNRICSRVCFLLVVGIMVTPLEASDAIQVGEARFTIGMSKAEAIATAKTSLAVVPVDGLEKVFLYRRNSTGQPFGHVIGALDFDDSGLVHIRRDVGTLEAEDAVLLGRRIAAVIADSGGTSSTPEVIIQHTQAYSTGIRSVVDFELRDRVLRLQTWESSVSETTSSFDVIEHFGDYDYIQ